MTFWILACSAITMIAAGAAYSFTHRRTRITTDQVSSNWLATARIHEDQE